MVTPGEPTSTWLPKYVTRYVLIRHAVPSSTSVLCLDNLPVIRPGRKCIESVLNLFDPPNCILLGGIYLRVISKQGYLDSMLPRYTVDVDGKQERS